MMKTLMMTLAALLIAAPAALAQSSNADEAEAFVQNQANQVIATLTELNEGQTDLSTVRAEFRDRIDALADVDRISNFVLGRYRRTASEDELNAFRSAFRTYAISVYESELSAYSGQQLEVTGSVTRNPGDYIVQSRVFGGPNGEEFDVNWRILETEGELKAVDVEVLGVWLAQTQREQILAVIGDNRGDVSAATSMLRNRETGEDA